MSVTMKKTTTTKLVVKGASVEDGQLMVDKEEYDFQDLLDKFEGCDFDVTFTEKTEEEVPEEN